MTRATTEFNNLNAVLYDKEQDAILELQRDAEGFCITYQDLTHRYIYFSFPKRPTPNKIETLTSLF